MNKRFRLAAFLALAAIVAGLSGGAGATNAPTGTASAGSKGVASTAAARRGALLADANLETIAGAKRYLRAIGVNPRGVVIQRGAHNYAGPSCPGAGWSCTSTAHPVVQIARRGGTNSFLCTTGSCAVVQATTSANKATKARSLTAAAVVTNTAKCIKTTGVTQSCSISQTNATANNEAIVVEIVSKASGLTQTVSSTAQITQHATGPSNTNTACVLQTVNVDGSTVAKKGTPVTVTLEGHQSIAITQDAVGGSNTVQKATTSGSCDNSTPPDDLPVVPLTQSQTLSSTATGSNTITQWENKADNGSNVSLDIEQNQSTANASGQNTAAFSQTNTLSAIANTAGPVIQIQSSSSGGIQAKINQFSHGVSKAYADQQETQCEHAQTVGASTCTAGLGTPPSSLTQTQFGPARTGGGSLAARGSRHLTRVSKGPCCSTQGDNENDVFHVTQSSKQTNDTGKGQTNKVQGDCNTSGNCEATQNTNINNQQTTNTQSGKNVSASVTCTGTACTTSGDVFVSLADGTVRQYRPDGTLVRTLQTGSPFFVTGGAFDSGGNLYVTEFGSNAVAKFAPGGAFIGTFGSGYNLSPESIVFDNSGNAYVGQADGTKHVLKFDSAGNSLGSFAPAIEDRGTDWIDLAADQCTLYYTSEDTSVKRFDVCTNQQLPDFATGLTGGPAFALRLLPDGTVLVADSSFIFHLDTLGQVVQSYSTPAGGFWFGLSLDPDGTSFWAANTGTADVVKFNIATAAVEASFNTGTGANTLGGVTVAPAVAN